MFAPCQRSHRAHFQLCRLRKTEDYRILRVHEASACFRGIIWYVWLVLFLCSNWVLGTFFSILFAFFFELSFISLPVLKRENRDLLAGQDVQPRVGSSEFRTGTCASLECGVNFFQLGCHSEFTMMLAGVQLHLGSRIPAWICAKGHGDYLRHGISRQIRFLEAFGSLGFHLTHLGGHRNSLWAPSLLCDIWLSQWLCEAPFISLPQKRATHQEYPFPIAGAWGATNKQSPFKINEFKWWSEKLFWRFQREGPWPWQKEEGWTPPKWQWCVPLS